MLEDRNIRVSDLARLDANEAKTIGHMVVTFVPTRRQTIELSATQQATLLRRRLPGYELRLLLEGSAVFAAPAAETANKDGRAGRACFALWQNLTAGSYLTRETLQPADCDNTSRAQLSLRYDPEAGASVTSRDLPAGTYLGPISPPPAHFAKAGDDMTLKVTVGPVVIERQTVALQPSGVGHAIFVRTRDGQIVAAPFENLKVEGHRQ